MERLCDLEYETFNTPYGEGKTLKKCIPKEGVSLYEIKATYAKQVPPTTYYYLGRNKQDARKRFLNTIPYMNITSTRLIPPGEEREQILTNPMRMPLT